MSAAFEARDPGFESRVRASFARQGAMRLLGATMSRVAPGECEVRLPWRDELGQQHGFFHGGVLATIADSAAGFASFTLMPPDATVLTIEYKTNFLAPARGEQLIARGHVVKPGRTVSVAEARTFALAGGEETLVATLTATMMVVTHHDEKDA